MLAWSPEYNGLEYPGLIATLGPQALRFFALLSGSTNMILESKDLRKIERSFMSRKS